MSTCEPGLGNADREVSGSRARTVLACLVTVFFAGACGSPETDLATPGSKRVASLPANFAVVSAEAGLASFRHVTGAYGKKWFPETVGGGVGFLDYDADGWQDVVLVGGGMWPGRDTTETRALWVFRNNGDGTFSDATEAVGVAQLRAYGLGLAIADTDNDGDDDIFLTTLGRNMYLRNDDGRFVEVANDAGLGDGERWSTSAIFFDADVDGFVDLYVGNYVDWAPEKDIWCTIDGVTKAYCTPQLYTGVPGDFYHNNGDGTFSNWGERSGLLASPGKTLGVAEWDFNEDGWPDLVVANDTQRDLLFYNNGDGTFSERGVAAGIAFDENGRSRAGMGIDVGVVDESGKPAVVVGHFVNEMIGVYQQVESELFVDRAAQSKIGRPSLETLTFGLLFTDADVDGDLDLFVGNGHIDEDAERVQEGIAYRQNLQLFYNIGDGKFEDRGPPSDLLIVGRSVATADYDRDGDEDIIVTENGGPVYLLRNDSAGRAVRVRLTGTTGNRDAVGAQVVATVGGKRMHRRVHTGSSFLASSDKGMTFALGSAAKLDTLMIRWPGGRVDRYADIPISSPELEIVEGIRPAIPQ